ncbi:MAG: hypothetical protein ACE5KA_02145 [Nitrososphaerales archaeon]
MRLTRGKVIIIAIFVAIVASLVGLVGFTNLEQDIISPDITVTLENVKMKKIDNNNPDLMFVQVDVAILNEAEQTLAVSQIDYDMYANETLIGRGSLSLQDIPLTGRAPLFPGSVTTLPTEMQLRKSEDIVEVWDKLFNNDTQDITWQAEGVAQIETAFTIIEKDFESSL